MKAISIKQPYAYAILHLGKPVENRSWPTYFRGRVAIHSSKNVDHEGIDTLREEGYEIPDDLPTGCFLGEADVVDCHPAPRDMSPCCGRWGCPDAFHHVMRNTVAYDKPIPGRGQLGYFEWSKPA